MISTIHKESTARRLSVLIAALAFSVAAPEAGAQPGNEDEEGKKPPAVYKAITKPKTINKANTENDASSNMRKTVPIKPSMKIPPHFPHPPADYDSTPPIDPTGTGYTPPTKKGQPTPPSTSGNPQGDEMGGSGGGDQPKGLSGQGGGAGGSGEKTTLGLSSEEEFDIGVKYKKKPKGFKFSFNIEDYDLAELIKAIAKITGKKFVLSAKVKQNIKATIIAPTPITASEAYQAFLSVLEVNGLTIVPEGKFLKIVDSVGSASLAVPTYGMGAAYPTDDRVVTRIHKLEFAKADELAQVLSKFKSKVGDVTPYGLTNSLIMTDYGSNIQRLMKIISALDIPGTGTKIWVEPINYSSAEDLAGKLQEVMEAAGMTDQKGKGGGLAKPIPLSPKGPKGQGAQADMLEAMESEATVSKIIAEDRTNALIIVATKGAYLRVIELIRKLDIPIPGEGEIHVHYLQHSDAEELSNTLSSLTQGVKGRKSKGAAKEAGAGELFEGEIKITHDKPTNSLVIVSTTRDYASLRKVIEKLDIPRRQVFVEAIIMEVTLVKQRTLGMSTHGGTASNFGGLDEKGLVYGASTFSGLSSILIDPTSLMGLAVGLRGPEITGAEGILGTGISIPSFGVTINALQTNNDVNILSTPNILATDNEQAEITVGGNVPIQQGFGGWGSMLGAAAGQAGGTSGLAGLAGLAGGGGYGMGPMVSVGRQNVGLTLRITPHINESDQIRMEIEIEISEVSGETDLGPLIDQRMAKTVSVVKDQQTVVLGGLITDNETETIDKVPFLGDIPILGYLFKKKKKRITKRNLLIFLTPYIIRDATDFRAIFNRKMEERREFIEQMTAFKSGDYEAAVDYTRTNGIVEEIHKTFIELEEEQMMIDQLKLNPPPEHLAVDPIDVLIKEALTAPASSSFVDEGSVDEGSVGEGSVGEESVQPEPSVQ
ncbi:MAG: type II secretion system secretin GspD [Pseudomonadota bacterium]